jgi:hypothetical protein
MKVWKWRATAATLRLMMTSDLQSRKAAALVPAAVSSNFLPKWDVQSCHMAVAGRVISTVKYYHPLTRFVKPSLGNYIFYW